MVERGSSAAWAQCRSAVVAVALLCAGCSTISSVSNSLFGGSSAPVAGQEGYIKGFLGGVVADEPRAALIGRQILSGGGNAADAAVAMAFALSVTLPSRAGIGGSGACLAYSPGRDTINKGVPEAILFTPEAASSSAGADRPAAVPSLPRGMYLLHARYGHQQFESLIVPAEQMARFGTPASRAFVRDLSLVSGPLFADPQARAVFSANGTPLVEGQRLLQPDLAATLTQLRVAGVGDLYQGTLARRLASASPAAGGPITLDDLRRALPRAEDAITLPNGRDTVAFLPPPADGGLAAAAGFLVLQHDPSAFANASARALAVASRWRSGGGDPQALLTAQLTTSTLPPLPASTTFIALDHDGNAVACAVTMDNLFGTGRIVPGMGFLLAASPTAVPPPLLAAAIAWNANVHAFRAAVAGSGQEGAPMAVAVGMLNTLRAQVPMPQPVPDPGRADVIACSRYLPGENGSCGFAVDPRESGLALGGGG